MFRRALGLLALSVVAIALMSPLSPVALSSAGAEQDSSGDLLFLHVRGAANRKTGTAPDRFAYLLDVYDPSNRRIGTVTHDASFTSATTAEIISTFELPGGVLVNRAIEAFAPDTSRQNQFLTGIHPEGETLLGDKGTGAYAGRTGRLRMSGWHETSKFPDTLGVNDFYVIELNPKG